MYTYIYLKKLHVLVNFVLRFAKNYRLHDPFKRILIHLWIMKVQKKKMQTNKFSWERLSNLLLLGQHNPMHLNHYKKTMSVFRTSNHWTLNLILFISEMIEFQFKAHYCIVCMSATHFCKWCTRLNDYNTFPYIQVPEWFPG